ncbi:Hypothetical predicted protein [Paramuricea clavata]|uniref:Uncharacterized protein n=1 Tax=Paramuricea clavata TaxID=317549 RepID=A0A7D9JU87_PARCT|nr:Hypothetical predicted protein [Paramuricea clavata]
MIFLTETWLSDKHLDKEILPHNYDVFRVDRKHKTGGGVLIAIKELSFTEVKQVAIDQYPDLEIVCVECSTGKDKQTLVACCYRPPNSTQNWFLSFKEFLKWAGRAYEKIIITGDFNFPKISWSESAVIPGGEPEYLFYNTLSDHYLSQLVYIPTREQNTLDLLLTNMPDNIANVDIIDSSTYNLFSDHKCILFEFTQKLPASRKIRRTTYDYKRADFEGMNRALETFDSSNAQETANLFNYYFNSVFLKESDENYHPVPPVSNESITEIILEQCEVRNALNSLNPNKAFGPDNIPTRLLKECASSIAPSLTYLLINR